MVNNNCQTNLSPILFPTDHPLFAEHRKHVERIETLIEMRGSYEVLSSTVRSFISIKQADKDKKDSLDLDRLIANSSPVYLLDILFTGIVVSYAQGFVSSNSGWINLNDKTDKVFSSNSKLINYHELMIYLRHNLAAHIGTTLRRWNNT